MDDKTIIILSVSGIVGLVLIALGFVVFRETPALFSTVVVVALIVAAAPISLIKYNEMTKIKLIEDMFPQFMQDLVEAVRSGMTLPMALKSVVQNEYGALSYHLKKLNAQLDWGIPFARAFLSFARSTNSKLVGRISSTVIESHEYGGNLTDIFESISKTTVEIERLREERKLYLNSQIISGYVIFFIFLAVIIGLQKFLVPTLADISLKQQTEGQVDLQQQQAKQLTVEYKTIFLNLIILQGLFAGLVIGKMSEGELSAGVKHSAGMMIGGLLIFTLSTI